MLYRTIARDRHETAASQHMLNAAYRAQRASRAARRQARRLELMARVFATLSHWSGGQARRLQARAVTHRTSAC